MINEKNETYIVGPLWNVVVKQKNGVDIILNNLEGKLLFGRNTNGQELAQGYSLISVNDKCVSRKHVLLINIGENLVQFNNISNKNSAKLADGTLIEPNSQTEILIKNNTPFCFIIGETSVQVNISKTPCALLSSNIKTIESDITNSDERIIKPNRQSDVDCNNYFIDLLPSHKEKNGLPKIINFWKNHFENQNQSHPLRVGLIYGSAGCGKTSLIKQGLLPQLARSVLNIYVDASSGNTEDSILTSLKNLIPSLPNNISFTNALKAVRTGFLPKGATKLIIVIDQFEQWLHNNGADSQNELVQGFMNCDGNRLQALTIVRDDFMLAIHRFFYQLKLLPPRDGNNAQKLDSFDFNYIKNNFIAFSQFHGLSISDTGSFIDLDLQGIISRVEQWPDNSINARSGVLQAIDISLRDPAMGLTRIRKVLELIVHEIYELRYSEPVGTRPLENLLDRLVKDGHLSKRLEAYSSVVRKLGNLGTHHGYNEQISFRDVISSVHEIEHVVSWYYNFEIEEISKCLRLKNNIEFTDEIVSKLIDLVSDDGSVVASNLCFLVDVLKYCYGQSGIDFELNEISGKIKKYFEDIIVGKKASPVLLIKKSSTLAILNALVPLNGFPYKSGFKTFKELIVRSDLVSNPRLFLSIMDVLENQLKFIRITDIEAFSESILETIDPSDISCSHNDLDDSKFSNFDFLSLSKIYVFYNSFVAKGVKQMLDYI